MFCLNKIVHINSKQPSGTISSNLWESLKINNGSKSNVILVSLILYNEKEQDRYNIHLLQY